MTNPEALPDRVDRIEQKLDSLTTSIDRRFADVDRRFADVDRRFDAVDRRFDDVDRRFNDVTDALVEQRQYTEFAFERLDKRLTAMDVKLDEVLHILRR